MPTVDPPDFDFVTSCKVIQAVGEIYCLTYLKLWRGWIRFFNLKLPIDTDPVILLQLISKSIYQLICQSTSQMVSYFITHLINHYGILGFCKICFLLTKTK